jgi:hypothetical protein
VAVWAASEHQQGCGNYGLEPPWEHSSDTGRPSCKQCEDITQFRRDYKQRQDSGKITGQRNDKDVSIIPSSPHFTLNATQEEQWQANSWWQARLEHRMTENKPSRSLFCRWRQRRPSRSLALVGLTVR